MSESPPLKIVKLDWESDEDLHFSLATDMLVNFDENHFYIRFYQTSPPAIIGGDLPDTVKAKLVTGVVLPASKMRSVIEALSQNYNKYTERAREDADFGLDELSNEGGNDE